MRTIDCKAFQHFLDESADGPTLAADYQTHVESCPACRREWQAHQEMVAAFQRERMPDLSPQFTMNVMARLPLAVPKATRFDMELILIIGMIVAGAVTVWLSLPASYKELVSYDKIAPYLQPAANWLMRFAAGMLASFKKIFPESLGEQFLVQSWKLIFISLVTLIVAKVAFILESRLRRMLR